MKFRISLSPDQIEWILSNPDCPADLRKQLKVHMLKISEGLVEPAYLIKSPEEKEAARQEAKTKKEISKLPSLSSDEQYALAIKYLAQNQPIPEHLMPGYLSYRYAADMMDEEEAAAYELTLGDF